MIGVTNIKESNNANLINLYSRICNNDHVEFGTFSGKTYGNSKLIEFNNLKISRD